MLLSGSKQFDNHNGAIEKFDKRSDKLLQRKFLHLYGFMLLSGGIQLDNHNGTIEKLDERSNK